MLFIIEYKNTYNKDDFQEYFEKYKKICTNKRITDKNIQNINEIRFYINYYKANQVIIFDINKPIILINLDNQKYIISVESIKNKEKIISPIIIFYNIFI